MNQTRVSVAILLVLLMGAGWMVLLGGQASQSAAQSDAIELARSYRDQELYAMSIQNYEQALAQSPSKELYQELAEVYQVYYGQNNTSAVRNDFADLLSRACGDYPREEAFWEQYVQIYLDREDYSEAYRVLNRAENARASSDTLKEQRQAVYYAFDVNYRSYIQVLPGSWDGCYVVQDREGWGLYTSAGETMLSAVYPMMGPVSADGMVVVTDADGDSWLMDDAGTPRAHYQGTAAQTGCRSEGLTPIQLAGEETWSYFSDDGQAVLSGYLEAGSFQDGQAAVRTSEGWQIIDEQGEQAEEGLWEDIRLDAAGRYDQDGCILAKSGGSWGIYSSSWKPREGFQCDDIDVHLDGAIAFCRDGLWGFVDEDGEEVIAPAYDQARSFSGGVAAVCKDGLWGFIDEEGQLVVDYQFADAGYFSPEDGSCPVQLEKGGRYQMIQWAAAR